MIRSFQIGEKKIVYLADDSGLKSIDVTAGMILSNNEEAVWPQQCVHRIKNFKILIIKKEYEERD